MKTKIVKDNTIDQKLELSASKMKHEGLSDTVIGFFKSLLKKVIMGDRGFISEKTDIEVVPQGMVIMHEDIRTDEIIQLGESQTGKFVNLKLNGGLATSMKLDKAKSLLEVQKARNFLDIIVQQMQTLRDASGVKVPLLLLDSFGTTEDSLAALEKYPDLKIDGVPLDMVQNKFPKINQEDYSPAAHLNEALNWNPPGHGDVYTVLYQTGVLQALVEKGFKYVLISNSDNLGATFDPAIVGFMEKEGVPFVMETAERTEADKKGGHLSKVQNSDKLRLRESANCPDDEKDSFQDISKWTDFNTNNVWVNLPSLLEVMEANGGIMPLDLIVNPKQNNPKAKSESGSSEDLKKVFQLETAMGSAITYFEGARAVRVDTTERFFPVKKVSDLFALRSDAFVIGEDGSLKLNGRKTKPVVLLDGKYYTSMDDLNKLTQYGVPSLKDADRLDIQGRFIFGKDVVIKGDVTLINAHPELKHAPFQTPVMIPDGTVLESGAYEYKPE